MATKSLCSIPDCDKPQYARGWCRSHYTRWWRHGDPIAGKTATGEPMRYYRDVVLAYEGDECLAWPFTTNGVGYGQVTKDGRQQLVSRLVCEEEHGPAPSLEHECAHSCGKGHLACVTKRHLSWKTPAGNSDDSLAHGTRARGERHGSVKLTEGQVREIRLLRNVLTQRKIAKKFSIGQQLVCLIQNNKVWKWLE